MLNDEKIMDLLQQHFEKNITLTEDQFKGYCECAMIVTSKE